MTHAGINPAFIYDFRKTWRILTAENNKCLIPAELAEWKLGWLRLFGQFLLFSQVEVLAFRLGRQSIRQAVEVYLIGRERLQAAVGTDGVVELQVRSSTALRGICRVKAQL